MLSHMVWKLLKALLTGTYHLGRQSPLLSSLHLPSCLEVSESSSLWTMVSRQQGHGLPWCTGVSSLKLQGYQLTLKYVSLSPWYS